MNETSWEIPQAPLYNTEQSTPFLLPRLLHEPTDRPTQTELILRPFCSCHSILSTFYQRWEGLEVWNHGNGIQLPCEKWSCRITVETWGICFVIKVVNFTWAGELFAPGLTSWLVQPVQPITIYQNLALDGVQYLYLGHEFDGLDGWVGQVIWPVDNLICDWNRQVRFTISGLVLWGLSKWVSLKCTPQRPSPLSGERKESFWTSATLLPCPAVDGCGARQAGGRCDKIAPDEGGIFGAQKNKFHSIWVSP